MRFLILLAAAAAIFGLLAWGFRWRSIDAFSWGALHKMWSIRLSFGGVVTFLGQQLGLWNMMPADVRALIPPSLLSAIGAVLMIAAVIASKVKQEKLGG